VNSFERGKVLEEGMALILKNKTATKEQRQVVEALLHYSTLSKTARDRLHAKIEDEEELHRFLYPPGGLLGEEGAVDSEAHFGTSIWKLHERQHTKPGERKRRAAASSRAALEREYGSSSRRATSE
jgi:hypothetical protein